MHKIITSDSFDVNPAAKTLPDADAEGFRVLAPTDLDGITLREIFVHEEDNDYEAWYLSEGGQFFRNVGKPDRRWMLMSESETMFLVEDVLPDDVHEKLRGAGFFKTAAPGV